MLEKPRDIERKSVSSIQHSITSEDCADMDITELACYSFIVEKPTAVAALHNERSTTMCCCKVYSH